MSSCPIFIKHWDPGDVFVQWKSIVGHFLDHEEQSQQENAGNVAPQSRNDTISDHIPDPPIGMVPSKTERSEDF